MTIINTPSSVKECTTSKEVDVQEDVQEDQSGLHSHLTEVAEYALEHIRIGRKQVEQRIGNLPEEYLENLYQRYMTPNTDGELPGYDDYKEEMIFFETGLNRMRAYSKQVLEECGHGPEHDETVECMHYISGISNMLWNEIQTIQHSEQLSTSAPKQNTHDEFAGQFESFDDPAFLAELDQLDRSREGHPQTSTPSCPAGPPTSTTTGGFSFPNTNQPQSNGGFSFPMHPQAGTAYTRLSHIAPNTGLQPPMIPHLDQQVQHAVLHAAMIPQSHLGPQPPQSGASAAIPSPHLQPAIPPVPKALSPHPPQLAAPTAGYSAHLGPHPQSNTPATILSPYLQPAAAPAPKASSPHPPQPAAPLAAGLSSHLPPPPHPSPHLQPVAPSAAGISHLQPVAPPATSILLLVSHKSSVPSSGPQPSTAPPLTSAITPHIATTKIDKDANQGCLMKQQRAALNNGIDALDKQLDMTASNTGLSREAVLIHWHAFTTNSANINVEMGRLKDTLLAWDEALSSQRGNEAPLPWANAAPRGGKKGTKARSRKGIAELLKKELTAIVHACADDTLHCLEFVKTSQKDITNNRTPILMYATEDSKEPKKYFYKDTISTTGSNRWKLLTPLHIDDDEEDDQGTCQPIITYGLQTRAAARAASVGPATPQQTTHSQSVAPESPTHRRAKSAGPTAPQQSRHD
ncbi:hypothetical protein Moror_5140 [Moniliophthora roreri MCA 2997]|uniref:Uncharacterized protein n=1 Tax=Moniliophthora roreri (strain MCA 2997) TaxID=1381753 RepID=V2X9W9_MONRO|nr:hypothetical protein Moror_5140 [Moniliophthora roreri MCA 2997]